MAKTRKLFRTYLSSQDYGRDVFSQDSQADAQESLVRLIRKAAEYTAKDGITRRVGIDVVTERVQ